MLKGRLGLDGARLAHADRHGLIQLDRGRLETRSGCLRFVAGDGVLPAGEYQIPFQALSAVLLGPGSSVTHDALRLLGRHGVALLAVGEGGVRLYSAPPVMAGASALARRQAGLWARPKSRMAVARRMYALRMGEVPAYRDIETLRGLEGARVRKAYARIAEEFGIEWRGRRYDRGNPGAADAPNQAINHAASAVTGAAMVAVAATATVPQLGFIHEDSAQAFVLDVSDLFRESVTLPVAFGAVAESAAGDAPLDRVVRRRANEAFARDKVISAMIARIKSLLGEAAP